MYIHFYELVSCACRWVKNLNKVFKQKPVNLPISYWYILVLHQYDIHKLLALATWIMVSWYCRVHSSCGNLFGVSNGVGMSEPRRWPEILLSSKWTKISGTNVALWWYWGKLVLLVHFFYTIIMSKIHSYSYWGHEVTQYMQRHYKLVSH
jgi:hypothetical protein